MRKLGLSKGSHETGKGIIFIFIAIIAGLFATGCSEHGFVPIWRLCGITLTDTEGNTAALYEGNEHAVFEVDLGSTDKYSIDIMRTEDASSLEGYDIAFMCDGVDIFSDTPTASFSVTNEGDSYIFNNIPSTEQTVEVVLMADGVAVDTLTIRIRKDKHIQDPADSQESIEIELSFDAGIDNPEFITIISDNPDAPGVEIAYTIDDSNQAWTTYNGSGIDLSGLAGIDGNSVLKAVAYTTTGNRAVSDVIELDYIEKTDDTSKPVYLVYSEKGLRTWATATKSNPSLDCILGKDIALKPIDGKSDTWAPIAKYHGTFDGKGHAISNVVINGTIGVGFFKECTGTVKDRDLISVNVTGTYEVGSIAGYVGTSGEIKGCTISDSSIVSGKSYVGGIAGISAHRTAFDSCINNGSVNGDSYIGGIIGSIGEYDKDGGLSSFFIVNMTGCENHGDIEGLDIIGGIAGLLPSTNSDIKGNINTGMISGEKYVGGFAGIFAGDTENNTNKGRIEAGSYAGGIIGLCPSEASIRSCKNEGDVIITGNYAGGILGDYDTDQSGLIMNNINAGNVEGSAHVGGITGRFGAGEIIHSSNSGSISGTGNAGGIAGTASNFSAIEASFNSGRITSDSYSGGIIGYGDGDTIDVIACYNTAIVEGRNAGGIAGFLSNTGTRRWNLHVYSCYSTGKIEGTSSSASIVGVSDDDGGWDTIEYSSCYWLSGTASTAGPHVEDSYKVSDWSDDSILTELNDDISSWNSEYEYKYITNPDGNSISEPFTIEFNDTEGSL